MSFAHKKLLIVVPLWCVQPRLVDLILRLKGLYLGGTFLLQQTDVTIVFSAIFLPQTPYLTMSGACITARPSLVS